MLLKSGYFFRSYMALTKWTVCELSINGLNRCRARIVLPAGTESQILSQLSRQISSVHMSQQKPFQGVCSTPFIHPRDCILRLSERMCDSRAGRARVEEVDGILKWIAPTMNPRIRYINRQTSSSFHFSLLELSTLDFPRSFGQAQSQ